MASQVTKLRALLPTYESRLQAFVQSSAKLCIVQTINPTTVQPRTLYILDSSFNPPSLAHFSLVESALKQHVASEKAGPCRLLLLFSTHNADKAPSPASFVQRIALMTVFAEDVSRKMKYAVHTVNPCISDVSIDVGLTKEPYYSDKSAVIDAQPPDCYASRPNHIHLVGYDTFVRFCNPKYYPGYNPPLSALKPFFGRGHKLRVTTRPTDANDGSSSQLGTLEDQKKSLDDLRHGSQEKAGFEKYWADMIDMTQLDEAIGVSSTRIRSAVKECDWYALRKLCTSGVAAWIQDQKLYEEQEEPNQG